MRDPGNGDGSYVVKCNLRQNCECIHIYFKGALFGFLGHECHSRRVCASANNRRLPSLQRFKRRKQRETPKRKKSMVAVVPVFSKTSEDGSKDCC